jgi:hypothetical protein
VIEFYQVIAGTPALRRIRDLGALFIQIFPGRKPFHIPETFAASPVAVSIDGKNSGPEAFHLRSILRLFHERFNSKTFQLIVYFDPRPENDALITEATAEAIAAGMNCLIVETCAEENASWCNFLAKHLSVLIAEARHGR